MNSPLVLDRPAMMLVLLLAFNVQPTLARDATAECSAFGGEKAKRWPPATASEDFSAFVNGGVPAMYFLIGTLDPQQVAESRKPEGNGHRPTIRHFLHLCLSHRSRQAYKR